MVATLLIAVSLIPGSVADSTDHQLAAWLWRGFLGTGTATLLFWAVDVGARFPSWRSDDAHVRVMAVVGAVQVAAGLLGIVSGPAYFSGTLIGLGLTTLLEPRAFAPLRPEPTQLPADRFVE